MRLSNREWWALLVILIALFAFVYFVRHADAQAPYNAQVEALINQARTQRGLSTLRVDVRLEDAAAFHNRWMADNGMYCHECPGEPNIDQRLLSVGYKWIAYGEILFAGPRIPEDAVAGWLASPGHHDIIVGNYRDIGCDYLYRPNTQWVHYWTCDFGNTNESIPPATVRPTQTWVIPTWTPFVVPTRAPTETPVVLPTWPTPVPFPTRTPFVWHTPTSYPTYVRPTLRPTATQWSPTTVPTAVIPTATVAPNTGGRTAYVAWNSPRQAHDLQGQLCAWGGGADCRWEAPYSFVVLRLDAQPYQVANFNKLCTLVYCN
jgi:hypothetical protein